MQALVAMIIVTSTDEDHIPQSPDSEELDEEDKKARLDQIEIEAEWKEADVDGDGGMSIPIDRLEIGDKLLKGQRREGRKTYKENTRSQPSKQNSPAPEALKGSQVSQHGLHQSSSRGDKGRDGYGNPYTPSW